MGAGQSSPSKLCDFSKKQVEKIIRETEELNNSRDEKIKLHPDFEKQVADANVAFKQDILFVVNTHPFNEKHALLVNEDMLKYPLIVKYILCCEVVHILKAYKIVLQEIVELCSKCQIQKDVQDVDRQVDRIMVKFQEANELSVAFSQNYIKGDIDGDEYGTNIYKAFVESTRTIHDMITNDEKVKDDMKELLESRAAMGGNRLRSKKRKQMKMKMKSSNYRSKTRNSKKKYNRKSVKK